MLIRRGEDRHPGLVLDFIRRALTLLLLSMLTVDFPDILYTWRKLVFIPGYWVVFLCLSYGSFCLTSELCHLYYSPGVYINFNMTGILKKFMGNVYHMQIMWTSKYLFIPKNFSIPLPMSFLRSLHTKANFSNFSWNNKKTINMLIASYFLGIFINKKPWKSDHTVVIDFHFTSEDTKARSVFKDTTWANKWRDLGHCPGLLIAASLLHSITQRTFLFTRLKKLVLRCCSSSKSLLTCSILHYTS